jgi:hypothetical protein
MLDKRATSFIKHPRNTARNVIEKCYRGIFQNDRQNIMQIYRFLVIVANIW